MDDFRVGSVPSSEPYGDRHPYGSIARKRQKHPDDHEGGEREDDTSDTFEASSEDQEPPATAGEPVEDYYLPSAPPADEE